MSRWTPLKVHNVLRRIVGGWWIFCGLWFALSSVVTLEVIEGAIGVVGIAAGTAMLRRPLRQEDLDWFKKFQGTSQR
jgi:hypothetical protein